MQRIIVAALVAVLLSLVATPASAQTAGTGTVTVLHGVPGLTVDVYAGNDVLIPGFEPGDQFGPTELPAGDYSIAVRPAGAPSDSDPAIAGDVTVPSGANATAIAHLDAEGSPTLSVFANDVTTLQADEARITVRHAANFGAVDVLAGGNAVLEGVQNGQEGTIQVPAGTYPIALTAAGDPDTEALAGDFTFEAGTAYFVHAIGNPAEGTFDLLVQAVDGLGAQVAGVSTGSGGLLAEESAGESPFMLAALALVATALVGAPALAFAIRRR